MTRWLGAVAVVLVVAVAVLVLRGALTGGGGAAAGGPSSLPGTVTTAAVKFSLRDATADPGADVSIVARAKDTRVAVYRKPSDRTPMRQVSRRTVDGRRLPVVFLVVDRRPGWVRVLLPVRPNRSRGWVRARAVTLRTSPYRVEIRLRAHRLIVRDRTGVVLRTGIAVGRAVSPTPTGRYFLADLLRPPDPKGFYGPYAFGLSAYSPVYTSFAGGDGQIGIHGTNQPAVIGTDVSHGCIRVRNAVIRKLAKRLPLGTPVRIER